MSTDQQRRVPVVTIVVVLLIMCVPAGHYWAASQFPQWAGRVVIRPSVVIFDIPVRLPIPIDLIYTLGVFLIAYSIVTIFFPGASVGQSFKRIKAALIAIIALLFFTVGAGLLYNSAMPYLTARVQQGIGTIGLNADLQVASQTMSLNGSLAVFAGFLIGLIVFVRKLRKRLPTPLTREQRMTPYDRMLQERRLPQVQQQVSKPVQLQQRTSSAVCYTPPVFTLKPLAVNYMPMQ